MDLSRMGIKLLAIDPVSVRVKDFVPVFHGWIQRQSVEDHQLIDVHDYSHIHHGPGILLVAHEGNFSTDMAEGKLGLAYFRKQPAASTLADELRTALKFARQATALIEAEPTLTGKIRFRNDELIVISNDRLLAPNSAATFDGIKAALFEVFGKTASFTHVSAGTKDRLTIRVMGLRMGNRTNS